MPHLKTPPTRAPASVTRWLAEIDTPEPLADEDTYWAERATEIEQDLLYYETARLNAAIYWHCPQANVKFWNELGEHQQRMIRAGFGGYCAASYVYRLGYDGQTIIRRRTFGLIEEISRKEDPLNEQEDGPR